jgi:hypothetical protein
MNSGGLLGFSPSTLLDFSVILNGCVQNPAGIKLQGMSSPEFRTCIQSGQRRTGFCKQLLIVSSRPRRRAIDISRAAVISMYVIVESKHERRLQAIEECERTASS